MIPGVRVTGLHVRFDNPQGIWVGKLHVMIFNGRVTHEEFSVRQADYAAMTAFVGGVVSGLAATYGVPALGF